MKRITQELRMSAILLMMLMLMVAVETQAQITGHVVDATNGQPVSMASIIYRSNKVAVRADSLGCFSIERHHGWRLTVSAVGYNPKVINIDSKTPATLIVRLKPNSKVLEEVTVSSKKRSKYSRKNNPAVELMKKVIAARKKTDIKTHDYYQYNNYQKIMFGLNDLKLDTLESKLFQRHPWLLNQVEVSAYNNKLILPLSVDEKVTQEIYRRDPHTEKSIIKGETSTGVNDLFQTGDIINQVLTECFTDIDIYEDDIRLFQYPFTSPIGKDAISFYRYYITDTTMVGTDRCIQLDFTPNNQQDFGFRGRLFVLDDSSYQVKRCELTIPKTSSVNWVENMQSIQEYTKQPNGDWVLTVDDMMVELYLSKLLSKFIVVRTTRHSDYDFTEVPRQLLRGKKKILKDAYAEMQDDDFWAKYRQVELTKSESSMDSFVKNLQQLKGFKYAIFALRALVENFVDTGTKEHPSKVDIGPINTIVSQNFYDKWRLRASAQTTANLHPHLFLKGYYARGMESNQNYYDAQLTYTFNRPGYLPREFPRKALYVESMRDVMLASDKFIQTDKDNLFTSLKFAEMDKMFLYNRQQVGVDYEMEWGLKLFGNVKTEKLQPIGNLSFTTLHDMDDPTQYYKQPKMTGLGRQSLRYTEATVGFRLAPGETFINTKQHRWPLSLDAPVFRLQHTMGFDGVLGGQYRYNFTEGEFYKRFWLPMNWGKFGVRTKFGAQWNQVPYPLLIMPVANLGYVLEDETFNLINNMEFLNDRYISVMADWDLNGKLFNRIPFLKRLKWREFISAKMLWGSLSDKNNPFLEENQSSDILMMFPDGSHVMDKSRPYWEVSVGIHNIFKLLHVEYIRRLSYNELPTAHKQIVKFTFRASF
ncbi:DUF5686 and carboxypeptidase regulatory-like domain-containing protein [Prevotella sp. E13-17]|uniref:DUF5686 family protein n=1 Tax=Prevotella sp. E13-17 TaxID=2913616 RepID=UPI001EDACBBE|nr:DUF5686 family protein [Prevotella sp. E13-17]UKK51583.1 DUF5686 and carboxypeptidase regulatory-like domain-containing protein [Prevotella sp. E13-17]